MVVSLLNECIEYALWRKAHNIIEYNDIDSLNDISNGDESPLLFVIEQTDNLIQYPLMFIKLFEIFKHLLEKGVNPNIIDVNMNMSIFTQIIIVIINYIHVFINSNNMEYTSYFKPFLIELIKYGADWEYGLENNNNAITNLFEYKNNEEYKQAYNRLIDILNEIYFELYENIRLLESEQRLALAKTGLPENVMDSITSELDIDAFDKVGKSLKDRQDYTNHPHYKLQSYNRYNPSESYNEYLENKQWAEIADFYDQYGGKKRNLTYKKNKR